jgi:hypothetical protein
MAVALGLVSGCVGATTRDRPQASAPTRASRQSHARVAVGFGSVWKVGFRSGTVTRTDRRTGGLQARIHLRLPRPLVSGAGDSRAFVPLYIALGHGAAWVLTDRGWVAEIAAASNRVVRLIRTPDDGTDGIDVGRRYVWVGAELGGLVRIEPANGRRVEVPVCWRRCSARGQRLNVTGVIANRDRVRVAGGGWHGPQYGTWRRTPRVRWPGMPRRRVPVALSTRPVGEIRLPLHS